MLEVTLRNAMNDQLTAYAQRPDWWNANVGLHPFETRRIHEAIHEVTIQKGSSATPGHVVAELSFGFWTSLLANKYHQRLWVPVLQYAFPRIAGTRRDLHRDLERLRRPSPYSEIGQRSQKGKQRTQRREIVAACNHPTASVYLLYR